MKDFASNKVAERLLASVVYAGTGLEVLATAVDLKTARNGTVIVDIGAIDAATTLTVKLQHSSDNATFTDVFAHNLTTAGFRVYAVNGLRRFMRVAYTATNLKNVTVAISVIAWDAYFSPVV